MQLGGERGAREGCLGHPRRAASQVEFRDCRV